MRLKVLALSVLLLVFMLKWGYSQQKQTYFRINFGYDFKLASGIYGTQMEENNDAYHQQVLDGSFGNGIHFSITGGYYLMDQVGLELEYQYRVSSKRLYRKVAYDDLYFLESNAKTYLSLLKTGGIFYLPLKKADLTLFSRLGLILPVKRRLIIESSIEGIESQSGYSFTTDQTEEFVFRFSPGFYSSIGAMKVLNKQFKIFAELEIGVGSGRFTSSELTKYRWTRYENGTVHVRDLYNLSTAERYTNHVKEINDKSNIATNPGYDPDVPTDKLTTYLPFSHVGINIGFIYTFKWHELLGIKKTRK